MKSRAVPKKNLYVDKVSGKDFQRAQYQKMVQQLRPGNLLFIGSIDRLAQNEQENIRRRQADGIAAAKARECNYE